MRLGYQSNGLQNHRFTDAIRLLAAHGYRAIGITPDTCHLDPGSTSIAELDELARRLEDLDLSPIMETGARFLLDPVSKHEPTLMTRDAAARQRRLDFYSRVAGMGQRLGARVLSFWTGVDRAPGPDSAARMLEGVRETCRRVRAEGLEPSLEPEPGMALETVRAYRELRAQLGAEAPGLTLDIGHLYAVFEGEPADVIVESAPFLCQVHLEDMRHGEHEHLEPGAGDVDFADVLTALKTTGYGGAVCFELSRSSHRAPAAVAACSELWNLHVGAARR